MNDTRRHHHVWRSYLEAWATSRMIFPAGRPDPYLEHQQRAVERDFHKLQTLTKADIAGARQLIGNAHPSAMRIFSQASAFARGCTLIYHRTVWAMPSLPPTLLSFYYPVSPSIAIIPDEVEERSGYAGVPVSTDQVIQVFGSSRIGLKSLSS